MNLYGAKEKLLFGNDNIFVLTKTEKGNNKIVSVIEKSSHLLR